MPNILSIDQQQPQRYCLQYLVPLQWYQQYQQTYKQRNTVKFDTNEQTINLKMKTQRIQRQEQQSILKQIGQRLNYLDIDNIVINPKLCINTKWKPISQQFYQQLKSNLNNNIKLPIFSISNRQKQKCIQITSLQINQYIEVKLLLCSYKQNHYIYGYFNIKNNMKLFIQTICNFYHYQINDKSRIVLINQNNEVGLNYKIKQYQFQDNQSIKVIIMVYGLMKYKQRDNMKQNNEIQHDQNCSQQQTIKLSDTDNTIFDDELNLQLSPSEYHKNNKMNINLDNLINKRPIHKIKTQRQSLQYPNHPTITHNNRQQQQATMADEQTLSLSQHTMSTGAQTPFEFPLQDQDWNLFRQYQNYGLFGDNLIDQIINMKEYGKQAIYSQLVEVPFIKLNSKLKEEECNVNKNKECNVNKNTNADNVNICQSHSQYQQKRNNFKIQLCLLAQSIQDNIFKRKIYQKQIVKDNKQIHKQSFLYKPSLSSRSSSLDSKQITSTKTIQSQRIITNKPKIHFMKGKQNY